MNLKEEIDYKGLYQYFLLGAPALNRTIILSEKKKMITYNINELTDKKVSLINIIKDVQKKINKKGALLLSGGVDSASILHTLSEKYNKINTYTLGFDVENEKYNMDLKIARKLAETYNTKHKEGIVDEKKFIKSFLEIIKKKNSAYLVNNVGNILINILLKKVKEKIVYTGNNAGIIFGYPTKNKQFILFLKMKKIHNFPRRVGNIFNKIPTIYPDKLFFAPISVPIIKEVIISKLLNKKPVNWYREILKYYYNEKLNSTQYYHHIWTHVISINVYREVMNNSMEINKKIHISPYFDENIYKKSLQLPYAIRVGKRGFKKYWKNKLKAPVKGYSMFPPVYQWSKEGELGEIIKQTIGDAKILNKKYTLTLFNYYIQGKKLYSSHLKWDMIYGMFLLEYYIQNKVL